MTSVARTFVDPRNSTDTPLVGNDSFVGEVSQCAGASSITGLLISPLPR